MDAVALTSLRSPLLLLWLAAFVGAAGFLGCMPKAPKADNARNEAATSTDAGTGVDVVATDDDDDDIVQGEESEPLTGIYLVSTDNARARCEHKRRAAGTFELECRAVVAVGAGKEFLADGIAVDTTLDWSKVVALEGEISGVACDVAPDFLSQTCELKTETPTARVKVDLDVKNQVTKVERRETSVVLLPFSIGVAAGFVPNVRALYKSVGKDGATGISLKDSPLAGDKPPLAGFQTTGFAKDRLPIEADSLCARGEDVFFTRGAFLFRLRGGEITLYAGTNSRTNAGSLDERSRLLLGNILSVLCPAETEDVVVLDTSEDRILRIPPTGPTQVIATMGPEGEAATSGESIEGKPALGYLPSPVWEFAMSPAGEVYLTTLFGIFRIAGDGKLRRVTSAAFGSDWNQQPPTDLSFDGSGRFYFIFDGVFYRLDGGGVPQPFIGTSDFDDGEPCPAVGAELGLRGYVYSARVVGDDVYVDQECLARAGLDRVVKAVLDEEIDTSSLGRSTEGGVYFSDSISSRLFVWDGKSAPVEVAGGGDGASLNVGKAATESFLSSLHAVTYVEDGIVVSNWTPGRLLKIDQSGIMSEVLYESVDENENFTPIAIAAGADGTIHVGDLYAGVGKLLPGGTYSVVLGYDPPEVLAFSRDGKLHGAPNSGGIYRLNPNGTRTLIAGTKLDQPAQGFAFGPDGDLFWTIAGVIYRRDAAGVVTRIRGPGAVGPDQASVELSSRGSEHLTGIVVANDGTIYFANHYEKSLNALKQVPGKAYWQESTVFGLNSNGAECGAGKVAGEVAGTDAADTLQASLSLICAGLIQGIAIKDTCPEEGGSTRLAFTQNFDFGGNVVEVVLPCFGEN